MARTDGPHALSSMSKKTHKRTSSTTPAAAAPDDDSEAGKPLQLQRRRVYRACVSCRRKKIKCDGVEPTCAQCQASNSECTWLQTKDRAALSRHYVQELEARLLHMEGLFNELGPVLEQVAPPGSSPSPPAGSPSGQHNLTQDQIAKAATILRSLHNKHIKSPSSPSSAPKSVPSSLEDDVSESFGQLALDEYGHTRWIGGSSTMSLIQSFKALTSSSPLQRYSPMEEDPSAPGPSVNKIYFPASVFFGKVRALPGPEEVEYPDRDLADKLVNAYFSRLHYLMPIIDKPSFLRKYTQLMDNPQDLEQARSETAFIALVFAVFACSANLVQDSRLSTGGSTDDGGMGMVYYERALILQYISHARIQPAHVQCFVLMASFLCSVNCLPQAWILVGQAVRTGQDVGLHRSPRRLQISPLEKELRRKIWWGVYTLDRMLAVALGRPLGINDADCDVEYPVEVDDEDLPNYFAGNPNAHEQPLMTGFVLLIKLYQIAGRILRDVYDLELCKDNLEEEQKADLASKVEALDHELTQWCDSLPPHLKNQHETNAQVSMSSVLCSHYYSVLTTLHRNLLPLKQGDQPAAPKSTIKAVSSARSCIRLAPSMKDVVPPSHHVAFFLQHLFSSSVILLLYVMHAPDVRASNAALEESRSALEALDSWEGQWPGAKKCKEFLLELTSTAQEAVTRKRSENAAIIVGNIFPGPSSQQGGMHGQAPPATASPSAIEGGGKRTVKISAGATSRRPARRGQSKDGGPSDRRLSAVSPYRSDGRRPRSTSRKRPYDDAEQHQQMTSHPLVFSGSAEGSAHSSPDTFNLPSPAVSSTTADHHRRDHSGSYAHHQQQQHLNLPTNPYSPPISPSASQSYAFEPYSPNPGLYSADGDGTFNSDQSYNNIYMDNSQFSYSDHFDQPFDGGMSTTVPVPSATFAAPGLPFRGLDYIRNFNQDTAGTVITRNTTGSMDGVGGGIDGSTDANSGGLWHNSSYDPGAFELNPDVPFSFGIMDGSGYDMNQGLHNGSSS